MGQMWLVLTCMGELVGTTCNSALIPIGRCLALSLMLPHHWVIFLLTPTPGPHAPLHPCYHLTLFPPFLAPSSPRIRLAARRRLLPLLAFPIFSLGDITCIYHEVKAVQVSHIHAMACM